MHGTTVGKKEIGSVHTYTNTSFREAIAAS